MSGKNSQAAQSIGSGLFSSDTLNFLKRFLAVFFMAISWAILGICIHLSPAWGVEPSETGLSQDREHFTEFGEDKGIQSLSYFSERYPDSRDISINIGRAAFEVGDCESALLAFDQALAYDPEFPLADKDSHAGYSIPGSQEKAAEYFQHMLSLNPTQDVQSSINKYLQEIKSSKKEHFLSARISLGLDFDDYASTAPASTDIGVTASLSDAITVTVDRPEKGQKRTSTASFDYLYKPKGSMASWKFSGMNYMAVYRDERDLDVNLYNFKGGASISRNRMTWDIYGMTNHLNRVYGQYLRTYGTGTTLNYAVTSYFMLSVDGKLKAKNYFEESDKDAKNVSVAVCPIFAFGRSHISLNVGFERENAREETNSYTKINGNATYKVTLPFASSAYVSYWYQGTGYRNANPLSDKSRADEVRYVSTGFTKSIPVWKSIPRKLEMDLNLNYMYTKSDSTMDLYACTKNVLSSGMSVAF